MNGSVLPSRGRVTINQVAEAAGVSRFRKVPSEWPPLPA
ncbi:MAG: hypothetical protein E7E29_22945, partial [Pseudomonas aeruginosa]|nr:hypothetical protein [Pseudomonas aeruginosa]